MKNSLFRTIITIILDVIWQQLRILSDVNHLATVSSEVQTDRMHHLQEDGLLVGSALMQFGDQIVFQPPRVMTVDQSSADPHGLIVSYDELVAWHRDQILARA